jgi:hypothetical protein
MEGRVVRGTRKYRISDLLEPGLGLPSSCGDALRGRAGHMSYVIAWPPGGRAVSCVARSWNVGCVAVREGQPRNMLVEWSSWPPLNVSAGGPTPHRSSLLHPGELGSAGPAPPSTTEVEDLRSAGCLGLERVCDPFARPTPQLGVSEYMALKWASSRISPVLREEAAEIDSRQLALPGLTSQRNQIVSVREFDERVHPDHARPRHGVASRPTTAQTSASSPLADVGDRRSHHF